MRDEDDIVVEICALLDQQLQALHGKLPDHESLDYARRNRRIDDLVNRLLAEDAWAEVT